MFNLIVNITAWKEGHDTFPGSRIFEYTEQSLTEKFRPAGEIDFTALMALPTVFVQETFGQGDQIARVGTILRMHMSGKDVVLEYAYDSRVPRILNRHFQTFAAELGIDRFQFSRSHWSIKNADLFHSLLKNLQPRRRPTIFQIADPENIQAKLVSAMMPFHPSFTSVYETLKKVAENVGFQCRRADDIWKNPTIIQDVVSLIDRSRVVICDCSTRNPNVFYEIGIAHTLGREVILITQSEDDIPFDLMHLRYVKYLNNGEGLIDLEKRLQSRLESFV